MRTIKFLLIIVLSLVNFLNLVNVVKLAKDNKPDLAVGGALFGIVILAITFLLLLTY